MNGKHRLIVFIVAGLLLIALLSSSAALTLSAYEPETGQVTIVRDEYGVPHVFGSTPESLWYGVGYAQAQDRLWQADLLRRQSGGTLAEFFGPGAVGGDIFSRTIFGSEQRRTEMLASAPAEIRMVLESFTAGMNAWIVEAATSGQLPLEYGAFGLSPQPWKPEDSIVIFQFLLTAFGEFGDDELTNAAQLQELTVRFGPAEGSKVFLDTHWLNDPDAITTVPAEGAVNPPYRGANPKTNLPPGLGLGLEQLQAAEQDWQRNLDRLGLRRGPASNAVVLGPGMTADGRPLLLGGPQMGYSVPQINHEIGIHQGNLHVTGMEIAGVPWVPIGVTEEFAWTMTSGISDNVDIYVEIVNPENSGQYLFAGEWQPFDCRPETFVVRGAADIVQPLCESVHGPVVGTAPGVAFTRKNGRS